METKQMTQAEITSWLGGKAKEEENPPDEQKKKETPMRIRGKLTKKEEEAMKKCHPDIRSMLGGKSVPDDKKKETKQRLQRKILNWKEVKKAGKKDVEEQDPVSPECELRPGWKSSQAKQTAKETGDNSTKADKASNRLEGAWEEDILQMGSRQDTTSLSTPRVRRARPAGRRVGP